MRAPLLATMAALAAAGTAAAAEPEAVPVFRAGEHAYASIRIPAVVATKAGTVLAFAEGRVAPRDQAENDIILKRSTDGGRTWGPLQVVAEKGRDSLNNPCAVVDAKTGRIVVLYQSYPAHIHERGGIEAGTEGTNTVRGFLVTSDDDGLTWSAPRDVTRGVKHAALATTIASGPGIGIQLRRGPHAGRLVMPFNEGPYGRWQVYAAFSDDGGATWTPGDNVPGGLETNAQGKTVSLVNEVQMAELDDGSVILNSRNQGGSRNRTAAVSRDGGRTWSALRVVPELFDAPCMAALLRTETGPRRTLWFSGPMKKNRAEGALWNSQDGGGTWRRDRTICPGPFAYSSLVELPGGLLGCLYETGDKGCYERIAFARFDAGSRAP